MINVYVYDKCYALVKSILCCFFFFQAEDGIRDDLVTGVQTCALPILLDRHTGLAAGYDSEPVRASRRGEHCGSVRERRPERSEERRGGEEWRSRWSPDH